jgi:murein DD-endopeptidase MepM/ murein hydrolase activator NlpD
VAKGFMVGIPAVARFLTRPVTWLWHRVAFPLGAVGYRFVMTGRRLFGLGMATSQTHVTKFFTAKHVAHVAIVVLTFFVTASNLYASNSIPTASDLDDRSVIEQLFRNQEEELLLEEYEELPAGSEAVSYLDGEALRPEDYVASGDTAVTGVASTDDVSEVAVVDSRSELMSDAVAGSDATGVAAVTTGAIKKNPIAEIITYVVREGDTPGAIARRHGISTATLLSANGLSNSGVIRPGQSLKILPVDGVLYTVRKGDALSKIAVKYGTTVSAILDANSLVDPGQVAIGTSLILPGGKLPVVAPTSSAAPSRLANNLIDVFVPKPSASSSTSTARLLWPTAVSRITQYFKKNHSGLDIAGPTGTAIYASEVGKVVFSGWNSGGYGNMIIVDHGRGLYTRYGHASKLLVKVGQEVTRGEVIALMGSTGRSTGPHLHYEVMVGSVSKRVNPFDYTAIK